MRRIPLLGLLLAGCPSQGDYDASTPGPRTQPDHIVVQHVLVSFGGARTKATRSKEEAARLAQEVYERAARGEDFDALVKQFTDDAHPGVYAMANLGIPPMEGETSRHRMVPGFGDAAFKLEAGQVGMAAWHDRDCPYGWHVIKRLK